MCIPFSQCKAVWGLTSLRFEIGEIICDFHDTTSEVSKFNLNVTNSSLYEPHKAPRRSGTCTVTRYTRQQYASLGFHRDDLQAQFP